MEQRDFTQGPGWRGLYFLGSIGCGGPLPARRFPGVRGGAAYIFWAHMVSNGIQLFFPQLVALDYGYIRLVA